MWAEEHGERVNHDRSREALLALGGLALGGQVPGGPPSSSPEGGGGVVATACPFCLTMLSDGINDLTGGKGPKAEDIATLVAERLSVVAPLHM
ncbi:MAG: hypothetical protein WC943_10065 [Elusimicrobiota bacterium]